jgi:hypothetical protein
MVPDGRKFDGLGHTMLAAKRRALLNARVGLKAPPGGGS